MIAYSVEGIAVRKNKKPFINSYPLSAIRYPLIPIFLVSVFLAILSAAEALPAVSIEDLVKDAEKYDGKAVIIKGEVIGDIMIRQEFAWINVRDETGAIGVFCPKDLVGEIEHQGGYKHIGDVVSIRGTFHRSCPQHGGDTDIHAERIAIIQKGKEISHPVDPRKVRLSLILLAITFVLTIVYLVARRRR